MDVTERRAPGAREAILGAATALIRDRGVAGTSISDVIAASGTSAGAIYHHFGSKERLVLEVGRGAMAVPMGMIMSTSTGLSPVELFEAALSRVSEDDTTPELLLQIWAGAKSEPLLWELLKGEVSTVKASIVSFIQGWCLANAPAADASSIAHVIMSLITGYAVQRGLGLGVDHVAYRDLGVRMLTAALEGTPAAS
ncbi:MAG: TetR/AcrR family transcriptional regulator [Propionicimonas sp.]|uniref:TetR/AcrR family transcriptional regulator n=1 Tax=Propionicimonas sp. TaxID=1955623 RepID=UPI003D1380A8